MQFNSWAFVVFAPLVILVSRMLRGRAYRWFMVAASYVFYGWAEPWYCFLLFASTLLDFVVAQRITASRGLGARKLWLSASLVGNLGLLGVFKYTGLLFATANDLAARLGADLALPIPDLPLPVGISFYTFQTLSYTIDVYRGKLPPAQRFDQFALYVAFFPQLVAGPIERATHLLGQLEDRMPRTGEDAMVGMTRIFWGLTKKIAFADPIGLYVQDAIADPAVTTAPELLLALTAFQIQLYLDFAAYSDIAIGLGRTMGVSLRENFRWPFLSRNPLEFWRRWHISFSTWLRDYLFLPLGGSRGSRARTLCNATLTFFLGGLWHGASWRFAIWGLSIGVMSAISQGIGWIRGCPLENDPDRPFHARQIPAIAVTLFGFHVTGIAFVARDATHWWQVLAGAATHWEGVLHPALIGESVLRTAALVAVAWLFHVVRGLRLTEPLERIRQPEAHGLLWAVCVLVILMLAPEETERFIYFQF